MKEEFRKFLTWYRMYQYRYMCEDFELVYKHYTEFLNSYAQTGSQEVSDNEEEKKKCNNKYVDKHECSMVNDCGKCSYYK